MENLIKYAFHKFCIHMYTSIHKKISTAIIMYACKYLLLRKQAFIFK
jgi:hypothetical protein